MLPARGVRVRRPRCPGECCRLCRRARASTVFSKTRSPEQPGGAKSLDSEWKGEYVGGWSPISRCRQPSEAPKAAVLERDRRRGWTQGIGACESGSIVLKSTSVADEFNRLQVGALRVGGSDTRRLWIGRFCPSTVFVTSTTTGRHGRDVIVVAAVWSVGESERDLPARLEAHSSAVRNRGANPGRENQERDQDLSNPERHPVRPLAVESLRTSESVSSIGSRSKKNR